MFNGTAHYFNGPWLVFQYHWFMVGSWWHHWKGWYFGHSHEPMIPAVFTKARWHGSSLSETFEESRAYWPLDDNMSPRNFNSLRNRLIFQVYSWFNLAIPWQFYTSLIFQLGISWITGVPIQSLAALAALAREPLRNDDVRSSQTTLQAAGTHHGADRRDQGLPFLTGFPDWGTDGGNSYGNIWNHRTQYGNIQPGLKHLRILKIWCIEIVGKTS